jgi:hypothetical protein
MFANFDYVREHALDTIDPSIHVARSGCVGFCQQICLDMLVGGDRVALNDEADGCSSGFHRHQAEVDVDRIGEDVRHAL